MQCFKHVAKIYSMMFKQLPTMISELNKLGIALKALDGMNLAAVGVNTGNLGAFRSAIKGLSTEQAVFALTSKGATEEQIRQILITKQSEVADVEAALAKAGLTTATSALTQAEMVELATNTGVAKADAEVLLNKIGITAAEEGQVAVKHQVTMAMLEQAVANGTLTTAEASQIATMLGLTAVEGGAIVTTNLLTAAVHKLNMAIKSNPWLFVIGAAITAIIASYEIAKKKAEDAEEAIKSAHEDAQQALDDTKTALSNDKSELESVNSELDSTKQKIQDIASQGTITLTEQNELDKLSTANTQLETQKSLLENNIKLKQKSAALDAKNLLDTQIEMDYSDIQDGKDIAFHKESYTYEEHAEYEANSLKNAYNIYMSALRDGDAEKQKIAQELIDATGGDTAELTSSLLEIVESFKYDDGTIIEGYEDLYNQYMGLIYNLQSLTNPEMFLDIAKQATEGTNVDYEKAISDGYAMAYDGEFYIDKLNQDFVKALADNGIDESTIEYIFKLKQQEYQSVVDNINKKYNPDNVLKPNYLTESGHVDTKEETAKKELNSKNYEQQKQEVQNINDELTEYAKEHPVEFQLITSYDKNFSTLDKYIEEEKSKSESAIQDTKSQLEDLSKNGNVDLTIRPVIDSSAMQAAGWDVEDGSIATTFTQGEFIWQGDEENGQYVYVHYTPISPDGKVMTPEEMSDYLYNQLEGAQNILDADNKGLVLKVDTDLQGISEDDIKALQEDGKQSAKMSNFLNQMGQWDNSLHDVQEGYYLTGDSVDYVDNAVNRLVEDVKKAKGEISNETSTSFLEVLNSEDNKDVKDKLLDLAKSGEITPKTLSSTKEYNELLTKTGTSAKSATNQILDLLTVQEKLSGLSQGLNKLKSAYEEFKNEDIGFVTAETLESLPDSFKNLPQFDLFSQIVGDPKSGAEAIQQAFNDIVKAYLLSQDTLQGLVGASEHEIQSYIANCKQMGITNADEIVNLAIQTLNSENELINAAQAEQELAYQRHLKDQSYDYEKYLKNQASQNTALVKALGETYKADYDNWCDLLQKKAELYNEFIKRIGNSYDAAYSAVGNMAKNGQDMSVSNIADTEAAASKYYQSVHDADKMKQQLKLDVAPISTDFGTSYSPSTSSSKSKDKSSKESKETFDFIETAIKRIEDAINKLKTKAENTFIGFAARANHYSSLLKKITEEINLQSNAYSQYMAKANSIGLSEVYASQVRNGSLNIVDITDDTLKEQIKDYQTWYEKAKECHDKIEELKITQTELTQANLELLVTKYEKLAEKISATNERIQNKIDLKESWGTYASASDYTQMNKNITKQISYITKQNEQLNQLMKTVEKGSEAWLEYNSRLDSNKASLQDLTKEISENATAIAKLAQEKAERKISKYDSSDEKLKAKIANSTSYNNQNKYVSSEISNINKRQNAYDEAVKTDSKGISTTSKSINKTKSTKENKSLLKKIKSYVKRKKEIPTSIIDKISKLGDNGNLYNKCVKYNAYISAYELDKETADLYKETSKQDKADLAQEKLNNIQTYYANRQGVFNQKSDQINARIDLAEESGLLASGEFYKQLIANEKKNNASLVAERDKLTVSLTQSLANGSIKKGSDEWYEMCQQIDDVSNSIDQSTLSLKQFENTMRQIKWDEFDYLEDKITNITNEFDFMVSELSRQDLTSDEVGGLTDEGNSVAYLRVAKYETLKNQLSDYYSELDKLEKTQDQFDTNVITRKEEIRKSIQDITSAIEDEKYAVIDLYKNGYESLSNKIKELISQYEDLLDSEKSAYEWRNTVADKVKEIADIRKQLQAYSGDTSEETKAKTQQLNVSLKDTEKSLKDSQYDKYISDTKNILDDLQEDMDNNIQSIIDNLNENFETLRNTIETNASTSAATVKNAMTGIGYESSDNFSTLLDNTITGSTIKASVDSMTTSINNLVTTLVAKADKNADSSNVENNNGNNNTTTQNASANKAVSDQEAVVASAKEKYDNAVNAYNISAQTTSNLQTEMANAASKYGVKSNKYKKARTKWEKSDSKTAELQNKMNEVQTAYEKELSKLNSLKKYSTGSKHIGNNQLAWTQDGGQELLYRASDGAVLTRVGYGDKIFTNEMSENLWKLAQMNPSMLNGVNNIKLPDFNKNMPRGDVYFDLGGVTMNGVNDMETFNKNLCDSICQNGKTIKCLVEAVSSMQMGKGIGNARLYK